jgi:uncharacterized protein (TIGR00251 family)
VPVRPGAGARGLIVAVAGTLKVRLQPRARRDEILGERGGALLVRLTAPPVEGRANEALCRLLARRLGVAPTSVTLIRGARSRDKVVRVEGLSSAEIVTALGLHQQE